MKSFYTDPVVRRRLVEFLGGDSLERATSVYVTSTDGLQYDPRMLRLPSELDWYLDRDLDIARSLADSDSLLLHLDIEYVNFDWPTKAYLDADRAFALQTPVIHAVEALLLGWGIRPLHMITGQGHHFVWKVPSDSGVARAIEALDPAPELGGRCMERVPPLLSGRITPRMQCAFSGLGLLMEFLAHRVKEEASGVCEIPVELTAVHVGAGRTRQREIVSIDISEYGDPLHTRMVRMPFTNYLKPKMAKLTGQMGLEGDTPALRMVPLHEMDTRGALRVRLMENEVRELASRACVRIPEQARGTAPFLEDYLASRLRRFHEYYYSTRHDEPERWPETYDRTPLDVLPACVRNIIENPNDLLLKPAGMQLVARTLLSQGWHPRHIAGLIRSKFENPAFGWGVNWNDYEPGTRADFYVRIFTGLYETGMDRLVDFNCASTREKGFCCHPASPGSCIDPFCEILLERQCR